MHRNVRIVGIVLLLHVGVLWALQAGLLRRAVEVFVPAQVLVEWDAPADPKEPPRPAAPAPAKTRLAPLSPPAPLAVDTPVQQSAQPSPAPVAPPTPTQSGESAAKTAAVTSVAVSTAATAPKLELPPSDADYLNNPKPPYPPLSRRMGEQGKVVVRALIGVDGTAQEVSIHQSSGFDRLDQSALATARKWRYQPGKRAGVAEAMWFNVPFTFLLE